MSEQIIYKPQTPMISGAGGGGFYPLTSADQVNIGDTKLSKDNKYFNLDLIYPIGSIYQSINNIDVRTLLGGEWTNVCDDYERVLIDDLNIYPETVTGTCPSQDDWSAPNYLVGSYDYNLLNGFQYNVPTGYHIEFMLSTLITTTNCRIKFFLNNLHSYDETTWSGSNFRVWVRSPYYTKDQIIIEQLPDYHNGNGINLTFKTLNTSGSNQSFSFYGVHILMYLVSDEPIYKWKRVK